MLSAKKSGKGSEPVPLIGFWPMSLGAPVSEKRQAAFLKGRKKGSFLTNGEDSIHFTGNVPGQRTWEHKPDIFEHNKK